MDITTFRFSTSTNARYLSASLFWLVLMCSAALGQIQVTSTGGTPIATYATLKGAFDAINAGVHTGVIQGRVLGNTVETATAVLNASGVGAASYTSISIFPDGGAAPDGVFAPSISGNIAGPLISLNSADGVTFDGDSGGGSLTLRNANPLGVTLRFANDASNNTIRDLTIEGATASATSGVVHFSTGTTTGNDNNRIINTVIRDRSDATGVPANLVYSAGTSPTVSNSGNSITNSTLKNFNFSALFFGAGNGDWAVTQCEIYEDAQRSTPLTAINLGFSLGTNTIQQNTIHDLNSTASAAAICLANVGITNVLGNKIYNLSAGTSVIGIEFEGSGNPVTATVVNNQITLSPPGATNPEIIGILALGVNINFLKVFYNTILIDGTASGNTDTFGFLREGSVGTNLELLNNIFFDNRTGGGGNHFAIADLSETSSITSDNNLPVGRGTTPADFFALSADGTIIPVSFAVWRSSGRDANSIASNPGGVFSTTIFVNPGIGGNLHINPGSGFGAPPPVSNTGVPLLKSLGLRDIDDELRSLTRPDIGADEFFVNRTLTSTGTLPSGNYDAIAVNNPGNVTLGGNVNVSTSFSVNTGASLSDGSTGVITGPGSFTLNAAARMIINNALGITNSGETGVVWVTGPRTYIGANFNLVGPANPQSTGDGLVGANSLIIDKTNPTDVVNITNSGLSVLNLEVTRGTVNVPSSDLGFVLIGLAGTLDLISGSTTYVSGDWTNNGIFNPNDATVAIIGTSPQTIGGTSTNAFDYLTVNNFVTLTSSGIINGGYGMSPKSIGGGASLELLNGTVTTGANTLTIGPNATVSRTNGSIVGNLKKVFSGPGSFAFDVSTDTAFVYSPVTATVVSGSGELTVNARNGSHPQITATNRLTKFWTLTKNSGTLSANLVFNYNDPGDIAGGGDANFRIHRIQGSQVVDFPNDCPPGVSQACVDPAANTGTINNVAAFSDWTLADPGGATAVNLISFAASSYDNGVFLQWQTGFEVDDLGFNMYREAAGKRVLINNQLIAGSALRAGSGVAVESGESYAWWDGGDAETGGRGDAANAAYWLEDVDLSGRSTWHGPFFARQVDGAPPARSQAARLSQLALNQSRADSSRTVEAVASPLRPSYEQTAQQSQLASGPAVKIAVKREGLYHISQQELVRGGLPAKVDPRLLQLFVEGREVPIIVSTGPGGSFDESASIEFYGLGLDTPLTDARTYWLIVGDKEGKRISSKEEKGVPSSSESFTHAVERRDRLIYFAALRNGERENFFGAVVASSAVDQMLSLPHLHDSATEQAVLEVALQGVTQQPHRALVELNGNRLGEVIFTNQEQGAAKFALPHSLLREGANTVRLVSVNGPSDISLVDYLRLNYQHTFTADNDTLRLRVTGNERITIGGFSSKAIRVFDVTDEDRVTELKGEVAQAKTGYSVTVAAAERGERTLLALTEAKASKPAAIEANLPSSWRSAKNQADLVIIAPREFFSAIEPLSIVRQSQGYKVALVDIEDIYDEFNFGNKSAQSIKDLLSMARSSWQLKPRFAMFAGDASFDARNYLGLGSGDLVPTKLVDTNFLETASDDWLADFNNDGIADLAVGRLPVRTVEEATSLVRKLVGYDSSKTAESALLVSDANDGFNFEQASAELRRLIESRLRVEELQRGRIDPDQARSRLMDAIRRGQKIVNYVGHGSVNVWRGNLLTSAEARELSNEGLPLIVMMTCLNGYFQDAVVDSLAESLIKAERGGAVAAWASSGLTYPDKQAEMNQALYRLLVDASSKGLGLSLGEAVLRAKQAVTDADIRRTWILLGDPTMRLR